MLLEKASLWVSTGVWRQPTGQETGLLAPAVPRGGTVGRYLRLSVESCHQARCPSGLTICDPFWRFQFYIPGTFLLFLPSSRTCEENGGKWTIGSSSFCFVFSVLNFILKNKVLASCGNTTAGILWKVLLSKKETEM